MRNGAKRFAQFGGAAALAGMLAGGSPAERAAVLQEGGAAAQSNSTTKVASEISGVYCNLRALSLEERKRHQELTLKLTGARLETVELADGYAFRLASDSVSIAELGEWVEGERKCCPFFDFEIEAGRDGGTLWLKLRGRDGVKALIHSEFRLAR